MLPNNQNEGNPQAPAGGSEQPTSTPSGAESQPLPDYVKVLQSQIAALQAESKGRQKAEDKFYGKVGSDIKRILELNGQGMNESQIQRELFLDKLMENQSAPVQQAAGPAKPNTSLDVDAVVRSLQFADNDPALAALKIKYGNDPNGLVQAAADLRLQQLNSPKPTPATGIPPSSGLPPSGGLTDQQAEQKSIELQRLYDNYSANKPQIEALEKELQAHWAKH